MIVLAIDIGVKNLAISRYDTETNKWIFNLFNIDMDKKCKSVAETRAKNIKKLILENIELFENSNVILIEQQVQANGTMKAVFNMLYAMLYYKYESRVQPMSSMHKTKLNNIPICSSKLERKKATIAYVNNYLKGEELKLFRSFKKQDDIADTICMIIHHLEKNNILM